MESCQRPNWRLWVGKQMNRAARALEFFIIGIIRPEDLIESSQRHYATTNQVAVLIQHSGDGLYPPEEKVLERFLPKVGSALVLGCGGGREAIALAKRGWRVVGIDNVPVVVETARANASREGVQIEFLCHDISQDIPLAQSFDLICFFGLVYSFIPTRKRRVQLLTACRKHLKPSGYCLFDFISAKPPSQRQVRAQRWRKTLAWLVGGNRGCELGDNLSNGTLFVHWFFTLSEIAEEAAEAGLSFAHEGDGIPHEMALLKPTTVMAAPSLTPQYVSSQ